MISFTPAQLLAEARRRGLIRDPLTTSLEELLCSERGFGLVGATAVQRAICRIADGRELGELASHPDVEAALGCSPLLVPPIAPQMMGIYSGIRTGKSLLTSALALRASQTVDVSGLSEGEIPRVSVLSLRRDLADVILDHIRGHIRKPSLKWLLMRTTSDTIVVRHPSGRPVEIQVVAGSRAGSSVVARWSAGVILDEAPRMVGSDEGIVNMDDVVHASLGRLLPGAQIVALGSPWAPFGPVFKMVTERHGKPGKDLVVVHCPANMMNPTWWSEERCAELAESDPIAYRTDVLAQFADSISGMFDSDLIDRCTRRGLAELPPVAGHHYVAAMDPATRVNAWTLVVSTLDATQKWQVVLARQWRGSARAPLSPDETLKEIAEVLRPYRCTTVISDQYSGDALKDLARPHGLYVRPIPFTSTNKIQWYDALRTLMQAGKVELPQTPELLMDLRRVQRRTTQAGVTIDLPTTPDGRHCDFAPALALCLGRRGIAPEDEQAVEEEQDPYLQAELHGADAPWWRH